MLDFKELSADGNDFELLVREILFEKGLKVYWSGKGPDGGKDLICIEESKSIIQNTEMRWLVQCKHNANSGKSVGINDLDAISDSCSQHNCTGYLLVCSTYPSTGVVNRLEGITANTGIKTTYWDSVKLERMLKTPKTWTIAQRFFNKSSKKIDWQVYATEYPNRWIANYDGYYLHLANRIGSDESMHFDIIEAKLKEMKSLKLLEDHMLCPRAIYYDDKHGDYVFFIDYLFPYNSKQIYDIEDFKAALGHQQIFNGQWFTFDLQEYSYFKYSDHYDINHYDFYIPYLENYNYGHERSNNNVRKSVNGDEEIIKLEEDISGDNEVFINNDFEQLIEAFNSLKFVSLIRGINSNIEYLDQFHSQFYWNDIIDNMQLNPDLFFSSRIIFDCDDIKELTVLISQFPNSVECRVDFSQRHLPPNYDESVYELTFSLHPYNVKNKVVGRKLLNELFKECTEIINSYIVAKPL